MPASLRSIPPSTLDVWLDSPAVQRLLGAEQSELIPLLTTHIGVRGLYLRPSEAAPARLSGNMMQAVSAVHREGQGFAGDIRFSDAELPLGADTISLVYALHVLETSTDGESLLTELTRVLQPEGLLIAVVLSPASPWRLRWPSAGIQSWPAQRLSRAASAAGLVIETVRGIGPVWPRAGTSPAAGGSVLGRLWDGVVTPLRASTVLVGRKRRVGMTPLRRKSGVAFRPGVSAS